MQLDVGSENWSMKDKHRNFGFINFASLLDEYARYVVFTTKGKNAISKQLLTSIDVVFVVVFMKLGQIFVDTIIKNSLQYGITVTLIILQLSLDAFIAVSMFRKETIANSKRPITLIVGLFMLGPDE